MCIPGHGQHITGLGHVQDLAVAMAQVIGREQAKGQVYNVQDVQSATFEGLAKLCAQAMGKGADEAKVRLYDKKQFDFGDQKAFPLREQHFFCAVDKAMQDLDWKPAFSMLDGLKDSYERDFKVKQAQGALKADFACDDIVLGDRRAAVQRYSGMAKDTT